MFTMISPLAAYLDENESKLAPRPASLDGKVLGLLPNWRPAAVKILKPLAALLEQRYRLKALVMEEPAVGLPLLDHRRVPAAEKLDGLAQRVDVVLTASGD